MATVLDLPSYAREYTPLRGTFIYFLVKRGEVVYVGRTRNIENRMLSHISRVRPDSIYYISASEFDTEGAWIKALDPPFNGCYHEAMMEVRDEEEEAGMAEAKPVHDRSDEAR